MCWGMIICVFYNSRTRVMCFCVCMNQDCRVVIVAATVCVPAVCCVWLGPGLYWWQMVEPVLSLSLSLPGQVSQGTACCFHSPSSRLFASQLFTRGACDPADQCHVLAERSTEGMFGTR